MNFNAVLDRQNRILVTVPKPTKELREQMAKHFSTITEQSKRRLRELRNEIINSLKSDIKDKSAMRQLEDKIKQFMDQQTGNLEALLSKKQEEISKS